MHYTTGFTDTLSVYKFKAVWLWRVFTSDFILQIMMLCVSCPPKPPALNNVPTGIGYCMRRGPGKRNEDVLQQSQLTIISTTLATQTRERRPRTSNVPATPTCAHSRWHCVCRSGREQLWHMQRAEGQERMYTKTNMHDKTLNRKTKLMNTHKMHLLPMQHHKMAEPCHGHCFHGTFCQSVIARAVQL